MNKFAKARDKHLLKGIKEANIDYAIDAIKFGTKRELIVENLILTVRKETEENANLLLDDLYKANGGEFKYENRWGCFLGIIVLLLGSAGAFDILYTLKHGGKLSLKEFILTPAAIIIGLYFIILAVRQKHKED